MYFCGFVKVYDLALYRYVGVQMTAGRHLLRPTLQWSGQKFDLPLPPPTRVAVAFAKKEHEEEVAEAQKQHAKLQVGGIIVFIDVTFVVECSVVCSQVSLEIDLEQCLWGLAAVNERQLTCPRL